jgi:hypothetical protein
VLSPFANEEQMQEVVERVLEAARMNDESQMSNE